MDKIILSSRNCLAWYAQKCKSATIDELLDCKTKIVTNNFYLAEQLIDLKKDYNHAYFSRKIQFAKVKHRLVSQDKMAVNKADYLAIIETEDILRSEQEFESTAYRLEQLIKHFGNMVDDITQRISVLKKENFNTNTI